MVIRRTCFLLLCILAACDSSPTTPESKWGYLRPLTDIDSSESAFSLAAKGLRSSSSSDGYPWNYRCEIKGPASTGTTCGTSFSNTSGHWRHNGQGWGLDTAYGDPIEITFGQPIYRVAIIATGSRDCFGTTQGSVTAFSAGGAQTTLPLVIPDTTDCGDDQVAGGALAIFAPGLAVERVVITSAQPLTYLLPDPPYDSVTGILNTTYSVAFENRPPCPPTGDSLLDLQEFRDTLQAYLARSMPSASEIGGVVWRDQLTGQRRFVPMDNMVSAPCRVSGQYLSNTATEAIEAVFHTHPYVPLSTVVCGGQSVRFNPFPTGGGSVNRDPQTGQYSGDWPNGVALSVQVGYPVMTYTIDASSYYRLDPIRNGVPTTPTDWSDPTWHKSWVVNPASCFR
jgi:hypothetical protein